MTAVTRWQEVGRALRAARGTLDMTEAARRSGNSRQWWLEAEKGIRPARPEKLAKAVIAVGGDLRAIFELVDYDPAPFLAEAEPVPQTWQGSQAEASVTQLVVAMAEEIGHLRSEVQRLADAVEQLAAPPAPRGGRPAGPRKSAAPASR